MHRFKKILIANRGEIAIRIVRACRDLGISPVAVYSERDHEALHVRLSDEAYCIGPPASTESYLAIDRILEAARKANVQAIHPGYGFLSENREFAQACADSGLTFIGPSASSMKLMGDKIASRAAVEQSGVPTIPGSGALQSLQEASRAASQIGYPVMLKASGGGGGKGLRVVHADHDLSSSYKTALGEAESAFGDHTIFMEKYLVKPRHVEVQVLGDLEGSLVHLGERECSIQRRHQKLVEESPSPMVDSRLRQRLGEAALTVARMAGYCNAGTVEFLVDTQGPSEEPSFYFLEMNTRLQVEHPVTEMVTGIDLVEEQILISEGQKLRYRQEDIRTLGAAIECRVYAEDPANQFFPCPGKITTYFEPSGPGVRNDSGVCSGSFIPVEYDPLISKVVTYGDNRRQALARMRRALSEYKIGGVRTTISFLAQLVSHPEFENGQLNTHFIADNRLLETPQQPAEEVVVPLLAAALSQQHKSRRLRLQSRRPSSAWKTHGRFPNHSPWRR